MGAGCRSSVLAQQLEPIKSSANDLNSIFHLKQNLASEGRSPMIDAR